MVPHLFCHNWLAEIKSDTISSKTLPLIVFRARCLDTSESSQICTSATAVVVVVVVVVAASFASKVQLL